MRLIYKYYDLPILLLVIVISFNQWIIIRSDKYLYDELESIPFKKTALVLGAAKNGRYGGINPYFKYRMEAAAELYLAGKVENILVSGDNHSVTYDEPTDMANYLVELGVPREKIILDYAGFRTIDSVIRAKKVFHCQQLIIVSQKFHNQRAVYAARHLGIDAVGYNARDVQSKNNFTHYREIVSKFVMVLDLHLLKTKPKFL
ncbi:MAG: ElyC/SanA/YdcF family protein [Crocinitomicaceae bacterium]|nr:YdcF family protein [Crocinitomicaceae bacterium]